MIDRHDAGLWAWMTRTYLKRVLLWTPVALANWWLWSRVLAITDWRGLVFAGLIVLATSVRTRLQLLWMQLASGGCVGLLGGSAVQTGRPDLWVLAGASLAITVVLFVLGYTVLRGGAPQGVWLCFGDGIEVPLITVPRWCSWCREHHHLALSAGDSIPLGGRWHRLRVERPTAGRVELLVLVDRDGVPRCPSPADLR